LAWDEILLGLAPAPERPSEPEERRGGFFSRLRDNLRRSSRALAQGLNELAFDPNDAGVWERLEELLIAADVGVPATVEIVQALEAEAAAGRLRTPEELRDELQRIVAARLEQPLERRALDLRDEPAVILVVGVNGTGKTTTIGKLAYQLHEAGASVVIGAADTFRAAAAEQLETWAERAHADFVGSASGSDPAAVAYDAVSAGVSRARRVVIVDTAGRLHTQEHLMEELAKVRRVIAAAAARGPARDAAHDRRHHGPERTATGAALHPGRRGHGARPDEARRERQGRDRDRDRTRARPAHQADRHGGGARGSAAIRRRRVRPRAVFRMTPEVGSGKLEQNEREGLASGERRAGARSARGSIRTISQGSIASQAPARRRQAPRFIL
jgi:fused signal recognition particle receptor